MRDIKFRGFDPVNKEMRFADIYETDEMSEWIIWDEPKDSPQNRGFHFEIMQFAGLQDKNGVDIYEGDILINDLGRVCEVRWHEHQAGFDCEFIKDTNYQKDTDMTLGFRNVHLYIFTEIIGNKFESPELLEQ